MISRYVFQDKLMKSSLLLREEVCSCLPVKMAEIVPVVSISHEGLFYNFLSALQYVYGASEGYRECSRLGKQYADHCYEVGVLFTCYF